MANPPKVLIKRRELICIAVILIAAMFWRAASGSAFSENGADTRFALTVNGTEAASGPLITNGVNSDARFFMIDNLPGFLFSVESGGVRVAESACPDKYCVRAGALRVPGQSAICVPFNMMLTVRSVGSDENTPDAVVMSPIYEFE